MELKILLAILHFSKSSCKSNMNHMSQFSHLDLNEIISVK